MARVWLIAAVVAASACSASPAGPSLAAPTDGGNLPGDDAGVPGSDASVDAPGDDAGTVPPDPTALATACGGTAPVTLDQWEDCYRKRKCEWEVGCFPSYPFRDVADCIASDDAMSGGQLTVERRERRRAIEQGRASINVDHFTQCLLRTDKTRCNTALHEPACLTRFTGSLADGGDCLTDVDCASPGATCASSCADACCVGTCQRKFRLNEACQDAESCEPGLVCTGLKCVTGDAGTPCAKGSVNQCDFGTFCDSKTLQCTPTRAPGDSCTSLLQCGGNYTCIGLSITGSQPGQCSRISEPGDRCDSFCFGNLFCDKPADKKIPGTCRSFAPLGQACSATIPCAGANAMCDNGLCALRSGVGVTCANQTCMPGLFCTSALGDPAPACAARRAVGQHCADPGHCESYLCSGGDPASSTCLPWSETCP